jgi:hypothetical protein
MGTVTVLLLMGMFACSKNAATSSTGYPSVSVKCGDQACVK